MPDEHAIDLVGYPGGRDVAGNWVNDQFQLDNFGEILLLLAAAAARDCLDVEHWRAAEITVDAISARWLEPDAGIWELQPRHWTHSRLTCVAGLRAIAKVAPAAQGSSWSGLADSIMAETASDSMHPTGRWPRTPDDDGVHASLLLAAIRGAVPASDPRSVATLDAVRHDLGRQGYVYRFRQDSRALNQGRGRFPPQP